MVKVTEVSGGGGPEVSSTKTRVSARTLGATGPTGSGDFSGTEARRPPQAGSAPSAKRRSQVAPPTGLRDIARIMKVRGEN